MTSANVQVTVEIIVDANTTVAAVKEGKRVLESALKEYGWSVVTAVKVVNERND
jgi:N-methylhydantoinase B/oxoprolinase/acetone carboxylase alpha subunit